MLAGVGFHFAPIQHHSPQLHRPPPLTPESPHPPPTPSAAAATKTPQHSSRRSKSWSSSADDTEVDHDLPLRRPTRSPSDPVDPPRRRRNTPSDLPAANPPGSGVTVSLAPACSLGRSSPCSENLHICPVRFKPIQLSTVEYSDTLLGRSRD